MIHDLSSAEIDRFLSTCSWGHMACCDEGKPYVIPLAFAYQRGILYGQTIEGHKTEILRRHPTVCFQAEQETENGWISAMCHGTYEELDFSLLTSELAQAIIHVLSKRLGTTQERFGIQIPFVAASGRVEPVAVNGKKATLFRVVVTEKSGKEYRKE